MKKNNTETNAKIKRSTSKKFMTKEIRSMLKDCDDIVLLNYIYVLLLKSFKDE